MEKETAMECLDRIIDRMVFAYSFINIRMTLSWLWCRSNFYYMQFENKLNSAS